MLGRCSTNRAMSPVLEIVRCVPPHSTFFFFIKFSKYKTQVIKFACHSCLATGTSHLLKLYSGPLRRDWWGQEKNVCECSLCGYRHMYATVCMWRSDGSSEVLALVFPLCLRQIFTRVCMLSLAGPQVPTVPLP